MMSKQSFAERVKSAIGIQGAVKDTIYPMLSYNAANIATSGAQYFFDLY